MKKLQNNTLINEKKKKSRKIYSNRYHFLSHALTFKALAFLRSATISAFELGLAFTRDSSFVSMIPLPVIAVGGPDLEIQNIILRISTHFDIEMSAIPKMVMEFSFIRFQSREHTYQHHNIIECSGKRNKHGVNRLRIILNRKFEIL